MRNVNTYPISNPLILVSCLQMLVTWKNKSCGNKSNLYLIWLGFTPWDGFHIWCCFGDQEPNIRQAQGLRVKSNITVILKEQNNKMSPDDILLYSQISDLSYHQRNSPPLPTADGDKIETLEHSAPNGISLSNPSPQGSENPVEEVGERM